VSSDDSFLPESTPNRFIFPWWLPDARNRESGEKATVHASTVIEKQNTVVYKHYRSNLVQKREMDTIWNEQSRVINIS